MIDAQIGYTVESDILVEDLGTIALLRPVSGRGLDWLHANVQSEGWQWFGSALAVEPRCLPLLVAGMLDDGLEVTS